jgi:hypothetical protein
VKEVWAMGTYSKGLHDVGSGGSMLVDESAWDVTL